MLPPKRLDRSHETEGSNAGDCSRDGRRSWWSLRGRPAKPLVQHEVAELVLDPGRSPGGSSCRPAW